MVTIRETHIGDTTGRCTLCGQPGAAYWVGHTGAVTVCYGCALDVLPALLADSVPCTSRAYIDAALRRAETTYWRAMALRMMREREVERQSAEDAA